MQQIIACTRSAVPERATEALRGIDGSSGMSVMEIKGSGQGNQGFNKNRLAIHRIDRSPCGEASLSK